MKTLTYSLLICLSLFTLSCKKDGVDNNSKNPLIGTYWVETELYNNDILFSLEFIDAKNVEWTIQSGGERAMGDGTYTYANQAISSITLYFDDDDEILTLKGSGTIKDNRMTLTLRDNDGVKTKYTFRSD